MSFPDAWSNKGQKLFQFKVRCSRRPLALCRFSVVHKNTLTDISSQQSTVFTCSTDINSGNSKTTTNNKLPFGKPSHGPGSVLGVLYSSSLILLVRKAISPCPVLYYSVIN